jgi:probable phosphoglycerate mutase
MNTSSPAFEVLLVRHGEAAARWAESRDPGLSELGRTQAEAFGAALAGQAPRRLLASPLLRARETGAPLARAWQREIEIDARFREIPGPEDFAARPAWLADVMRRSWDEVDAALLRWRESAWAALLALGEDSIVFTHYMVINALAGAALGETRLVAFAPDYVSATKLRVERGRVELLELGTAATTRIL